MGQQGAGVPLAAAFIDELIALGCRKFIACGGCAVSQFRGVTFGQILYIAATTNPATSGITATGRNGHQRDRSSSRLLRQPVVCFNIFEE